MAKAAAKRKVKAARPIPAMQVEPAQWPTRTVEFRKLAQLKPHPRNARTHPQAQIEEICASIAEHGFAKLSIVIDEADFILAGHGNVQALKRFGAQLDDVDIPVTVVRGWSDAQKRQFMLRDNKIAANAGWDKDALGLELLDIAQLPGVDLGLLGFKVAELDRLLPKQERAGLTDPDDAPEPTLPQQAVSLPGDLWLLGEHRLLCGDCTVPSHVATVLGDARPLLMDTDPPYGVDYDPNWRNDAAAQLGASVGGERAVGKVSNDDRADWRAAWALFPGDVVYVWHGGLHSSAVEASLASVGFEPRAQIIWAKDGLVVSRGHYHWQHEPCWYMVRKGANGLWAGDRSQSTLWEIPRPKKSETGHGIQKPIECMKRPIVNNSRKGDFVYDPFSGSGTTIIAAEMTERRCLAIEIDPVYVDVAVKRWEAFTGKCATLAAGGQRMVEAAKARGVKLVAAA